MTVAPNVDSDRTGKQLNTILVYHTVWLFLVFSVNIWSVLSVATLQASLRTLRGGILGSFTAFETAQKAAGLKHSSETLLHHIS